MRTAARVDANQGEIVQALRRVPGCRVLILSMVGHGCPDILVGFMGTLHLIEIKDGAKVPSKQKLTPDEKKFHAQWAHLPVHVVNSVDAAYRAIGLDVGAEVPF